MNNRDTQLAAIPIDFVVKQGLQEHTEVKRRPYSTLIRTWAKDQGQAELGEEIASRLKTSKEPERLKAELLVKIIRDIDVQMKNDSNWKWSLVMKVMLDEGMLVTNIPNKFDRLICSMIPGKGIDTVRKNGDYSILQDLRSWRSWIDDSEIDSDEVINRIVCEDIYDRFKPLIS